MTETNPKGIPIHLAFGEHSYTQRETINVLQDYARSLLNASEHGVVVWCIEEGTTPKQDKLAVNQKIENGIESQIAELVNITVPFRSTFLSEETVLSVKKESFF